MSETTEQMIDRIVREVVDEGAKDILKFIGGYDMYTTPFAPPRNKYKKNKKNKKNKKSK